MRAGTCDHNLAHACRVQVLSQLQGRTLLPWEREPWEKQDGLRCLGPLAACVGRLLARNPSKRPSAAEFVRDATAALESVAS